LEEIDISLHGLTLVLVDPGIHVSTSEAFKMIQPCSSSKKMHEILSMPLSKWKDELVNDFEKPVFDQYPEIGFIKKKMYEHGAIYSSMSGSGSSVFGLFEEKVAIDFGTSQSWVFQL
jgi:4-diphosphocytidyl-2-C-methyl-D-erythritol kinase